jgi:hypothetical protein
MIERIRRPIAWLVAVAGIGLALVLVLREARASSPTPQLPDLVVDEPDFVSLSVSETTPTGQPDEARLLLRFNGYLHNKGPGALDFRGSRGAPPNLSEPAVPMMNVFQRIYEYPTTSGEPPANPPFTDEASKGLMEYVDADGHHHWHLQHIAYYSLWNAAKTVEVAPAQKVGFCLEDSEHRELGIGPSKPVYTDSESSPLGSRQFCEELKPEATRVFEGISAGWRDLYERQLAFQWVDVSDVLPGEYFLRAEADPEHLVKQAPGEKPPVFKHEPTIVPGYDALAQSQSTEENQALGLTLSAQTWSGKEADEQPSPNHVYEIVSTPQHGTLGAVQGSQVTYTPAAGYTGVDSFTFATRDPNSAFPMHPAIATVTIAVGEPAPTVAVAGAPPSMIAGTSVQLSATVGNDATAVAWSASSGTITSSGIYTAPSAPPAGGAATVAVQTKRGARDERRIAIVAAPVPRAAPEAPTPRFRGPLSAPTAVLIGRRLYLTVKTSKTGLLRISAFVHRRVIGRCAKRMKDGLSFTCSMTLPKWASTHAQIGALATLRVGRHLFHTSRRAARVPTAMKAMKALHGISWSGVKLTARFFCGI